MFRIAHSRWTIIVLLLAGTAVGVFAGCGPRRLDASLPAPAFVSRLTGIAEELGQREMAAMNAAQEVYKTRVMYHPHCWTMMGEERGVYLKMYRDVKRFEVVDIEKAASLLHPFRYTVRYDFDWMGTPTHFSEEADGAKLAAQDSTFSVLRSGSITYAYTSAPDGTPLNVTNGKLPIRNYFATDLDLTPDQYPRFVD